MAKVLFLVAERCEGKIMKSKRVYVILSCFFHQVSSHIFFLLSPALFTFSHLTISVWNFFFVMKIYENICVSSVYCI